MATTRSDTVRRMPIWRPFLWGTIAALLALPAIAMLFTREVAWGPEDFAFAAILLISGGALFELAAWKIRDRVGRLVLAALLLGAVALLWAYAAVGVF
ncbi:MAG: hypothetical protein EON85_05140 [Brevundimonas sp.]|nr:MAG: hypothetical protein EON85_05140 [Brevundimonas sp.]